MNIPVVIPSAGLGTRLGCQTNKLNIKFVDEERLWEKQCNAIWDIYPKMEINYVTGFRADTIDKQLDKSGVTVHNNINFEKTNVAYSIQIGLREINKKDGCLIILGDLWFDKTFLLNLPKPSGHCFLISDFYDNFDKREIGVNKENGYMDYNFPQKWSQICYLSSEAIETFIYYASLKSNTKKYCFEILNEMTLNNQKFQILSASGCIVEIDRQKDINKINNIIANQHA